MTAPVLADTSGTGAVVTPPAGDSAAAGTTDTGQAPAGGTPAAGTTNPATGLPGATPAQTPPQGGDAAPREVAPPPGATPAAPPAAGTGRPPGEWNLDDFPPEIRDYVRGLRQEAGDHRVRAKTAEETAAARFEEQRQEWVGTLLKQLGLISEPPAEGEGGTPAPPEQQIEQLTAALGQRDNDHRDAMRELSIWKAAATAPTPANPQRLTDSRTFMQSIAGLDPTAADFDAKVAEAIAAAVERDGYYAATPPAGQVPPSQPSAPPVSHVGDFTGAPAGDDTPRTVDEFREQMSKRKRNDGNY